jgi:hypothetical protein
MAKPNEKPKPKDAPKPQADTRPSGRDFDDSQKYQYHKEQANAAFKAGDIVKSTNHLNAMRHAGKRLHDQAKWARQHKKAQ